VFGKGGSKDLTLDVYRPAEGVTSKRMAIVHLFGGGFFVGNKNAGYIINDAKALGAEATRASPRTIGSRAGLRGRRRFTT
jgi:carboxylesterase type B